MSALSDIDAAIDGLDDALRSAGLPELESPTEPSAVDEVAAAVAPHEIPAQLRRFWERVDGDRIGVVTFPTLRGPSTALELLRDLRALDVTVPIAPPPIFVPVDYASHCWGMIELGSVWSEGGTILEWGMDDFPLVFRAVADWIEVLAELVSEGRLERSGAYVSVDHPAEREKRLARLASSAPDPVYGDRHAIPIDIDSWPAHWLAASGIDLRDRVPRGATHTIAELVQAADHGPVTGRIQGQVTRAVGIGADTLVLVDDGTRPLDVWCPAGTSPWGPVHTRSFEFEVTLERPAGAPPDLDTGHAAVSHHALAGNLDAAQAAMDRFAHELEQHQPAAVASDIRPLDNW